MPIDRAMAPDLASPRHLAEPLDPSAPPCDGACTDQQMGF
jgi:hypothetical protein